MILKIGGGKLREFNAKKILKSYRKKKGKKQTWKEKWILHVFYFFSSEVAENLEFRI